MKQFQRPIISQEQPPTLPELEIMHDTKKQHKKTKEYSSASVIQRSFRYSTKLPVIGLHDTISFIGLHDTIGLHLGALHVLLFHIDLWWVSSIHVVLVCCVNLGSSLLHLPIQEQLLTCGRFCSDPGGRVGSWRAVLLALSLLHSTLPADGTQRGQLLPDVFTTCGGSLAIRV